MKPITFPTTYTNCKRREVRADCVQAIRRGDARLYQFLAVCDDGQPIPGDSRAP